MFSKKVKDVAEKIGQFYLQKEGGDYDKAANSIRELGIEEILVVEKIVLIKTKRPGILIGKRGINLENLSKFLDMDIRPIEVEDHIENWIIPINFDEEDYDTLRTDSSESG